MFYQTQPVQFLGLKGLSLMPFISRSANDVYYRLRTKSPQTPYSDFFVTMEAMVGIMFDAVVTGITFAKFSSVGDSVVFGSGNGHYNI